MNRINSYIDESLTGIEESKTLYLFEKSISDELNARANELTHSGLKDDKVIFDIILQEHPDIKGEYKRYLKKANAKRRALSRAKTKTLSVLLAALVTVAVYLAVSFITSAWSRTWLIIASGACVTLSVLSFIKVSELFSKERVYLIAVKLCFYSGLMLLSVPVFLIGTFIFGIEKCWIVFLLGVLFILCINCFFTAAAEQRFAVLTYLISVPAVFSLSYVILGLLNILPWHPWWLIAVSGVIADVVIMIVSSVRNSRYEEEVGEE